MTLKLVMWPRQRAQYIPTRNGISKHLLAFLRPCIAIPVDSPKPRVHQGSLLKNYRTVVIYMTFTSTSLRFKLQHTHAFSALYLYLRFKYFCVYTHSIEQVIWQRRQTLHPHALVFRWTLRSGRHISTTLL